MTDEHVTHEHVWGTTPTGGTFQCVSCPARTANPFAPDYVVDGKGYTRDEYYDLMERREASVWGNE